MKWLDIAIKILHIVAVIGTYAAVVELILTAIRAILSFFGYEDFTSLPERDSNPD